MTTAELDALRALVLLSTATVYGENPSTGRYDTVIKAGLACDLAHLPMVSRNYGERMETMSTRILRWDPSYVMPENAQVLIDGVRWQVQAGTFELRVGSNGALLFRQCDVVRQV
jgi:hypothetical protein